MHLSSLSQPPTRLRTKDERSYLAMYGGRLRPSCALLVVLPFLLCGGYSTCRDFLTADRISAAQAYLFEGFARHEDSVTAICLNTWTLFNIQHRSRLIALFTTIVSELRVITINHTIIHSTSITSFIQAQWVESQPNLRGWVSKQGNI